LTSGGKVSAPIKTINGLAVVKTYAFFDVSG